jgi:hypothetical protein
MTCKGICIHHKASGRYIYGHKHCQQCEIFIKCNGVRCPCCGYKLRSRPREFSNTKLREQKRIQNKHEPSSLSLSFEDVCPQWNNALSTRFSNNSRLNISEAKYCIVGEAHGFRNSTYICSKCWEYSQSFTHCVYGSGDYNNYSITDHILFEHLKENFIEHFNQSHVRKKGLRRAVKIWIAKAHKISIKLFMYISGLNHEETEDILYT